MADSRSDYRYRLIPGWPRLPAGTELGQVTGVAGDSERRIYVVSRQRRSVFVFDRDGDLMDRWGEDTFTNPHGICVGADGSVYITDIDDHTVRRFTPEGRLLRTVGTVGQEGEEGRPFHRPTGVAIAPSGELYVSDGYSGSWVHRFSEEGELIGSWGGSGAGPGQFDLPHGVCVGRDGRVWVADRGNGRIQVFSPDGEFLTQWTGMDLPCSLFIDEDGVVYVPELTHRLSIFDPGGRLLARWQDWGGEMPGRLVAPHTAWVDSNGHLYVSEVLEGQRVQKFARDG